jgi:hypothetical protein
MCCIDEHADLRFAHFTLEGCEMEGLQSAGSGNPRNPKKPNETKKPNEISLRQWAGFCFVATIVYHPVCDGDHQI